MALRRTDFETPEVTAAIPPEELRRLAHILTDDEGELPVVPVHLRSVGEAARDADRMCLRRLDANATARRASQALAKDSSLGFQWEPRRGEETGEDGR